MNKHLIISGRVQGVGFRYSAYQYAKVHNLVGWVRSKSNGTVELEVEGENNTINNYIEKLKLGLNPYIRVDHIMENVSQEEKGYNNFIIK